MCLLLTSFAHNLTKSLVSLIPVVMVSVAANENDDAGNAPAAETTALPLAASATAARPPSRPAAAVGAAAMAAAVVAADTVAAAVAEAGGRATGEIGADVKIACDVRMVNFGYWCCCEY